MNDRVENETYALREYAELKVSSHPRKEEEE
jgi:hypothetical protein